MITLSQETEALAQRVAGIQGISVEALIERALQAPARLSGIQHPPRPDRRMSVEQMLAFGAEIAAMKLLDTRSANEIMDDLNAA